jgi:hypothetical protein
LSRLSQSLVITCRSLKERHFPIVRSGRIHAIVAEARWPAVTLAQRPE